MHVIGTAGHVDHGKSTLVEALTGMDPDRLKEEKERAMTIDLGFAWMKTGEGQQEIGIIDVPGHRDFIENMLAGVGGIDLAVLVIAADEGVMPQTKEHLAILDLLQVTAGVVALTKVDLVDDPDWLELVTLDVLDTVSGTALADAPIIHVSPISSQGMDDLRAAILDELSNTPPRVDIGRPRLPIDRIFTLSGFGTIVTGTLLDGTFTVGDAVTIEPGEQRGRIRGLQTHGSKVDTARPGSRVAVNLSGTTKDVLERGSVVTLPNTLESTLLCDVSYRHLSDAHIPLKHDMEVKLYVGSAEVVAKTRVLGQRFIAPGEPGWLQLALKRPIAVSRGDRFILRRPSPASTIGGGTILDPHPGRRHRRFKPEVVARLKTLAQGTPEELLLQTAGRFEPVNQKDLVARTGLPHEQADVALQQLVDQGSIRFINEYVYTSAGWQKLRDRGLSSIAEYHHRMPLRLGIGREELRSRIRCEPIIFAELLEEMMGEFLVEEERGLLKLPGHTVTFSAAKQQHIDKLFRQLKAQDINSSSVKDVRAMIGDDEYAALIDLGQLVQISAEVVYSAPIYAQFVAQIRAFLQSEGKINVAQLRDLLSTSRKYAIAILEHLDDIHVTKRQGDDRLLVG